MAEQVLVIASSLEIFTMKYSILLQVLLLLWSEAKAARTKFTGVTMLELVIFWEGQTMIKFTQEMTTP